MNEGGGPGTGGTSSAGDAGVDASSDAGSDAGTPVEEADAGADSGTFCEPGSTLVCYEGDPETAGEGSCQTGLSECDSEGAAYGPCVGQVLPIAEDCSTPEDDDCDTLVNEDCPVPTTYDDVQPVLQARCSPCHSTGGSGGHNSATSYADTQLSSQYCSGATKGACLLVRVQDGSMPLAAGCTGDPDQDASNSSCLSAAEQQLLADWIADGQLP